MCLCRGGYSSVPTGGHAGVKDVHTGDAGVSCLPVAAVTPGK